MLAAGPEWLARKTKEPAVALKNGGGKRRLRLQRERVLTQELVKPASGWPKDSQFLVPVGVHSRFADLLGHRLARLEAEYKRSSVQFNLV